MEAKYEIDIDNREVQVTCRYKGGWIPWSLLKQAAQGKRAWFNDGTGKDPITDTKERAAAYMVAYDELLEKGLIVDD